MTDFERWRASLQPIKLDIVGDFAGGSLFGIYGEALLAHCVDSAGVDFGCELLLHAVHAVEVLLAKLGDRGCVFHVLWFSDEADICIPAQLQASPSLVSKYRLAREVLIEHLSRPVHFGDGSSTTLSYLFPGLERSSLRRYLKDNPIYFFLGSNAHPRIGGKVDGGTPLGMLHYIASAGCYIAFIEDIEFKSSKVYLPVVTPSVEIKPTHECDHLYAHTDLPSAKQLMLKIMKKLAALDAARYLTAREFISLSALASVLLSPVDAGTGDKITDGIPCHKQSVALLLYLSALRHCSLDQRSFAKEDMVGAMNTGSRFLTNFFDAARGGLASWFSGDFADLEWDAFDLFDGRLLISVSAWLHSDTALPFPWQISTRAVQMAELVDELGDTSLVSCDESGHPKFPFSSVILSWGELWPICPELSLS
ncbi:hypothetical protein OQA88_7442 [Cercophora sp. LCS_1]